MALDVVCQENAGGLVVVLLPRGLLSQHACSPLTLDKP